jgi:PAS domain S-box-containing protein
MTALEMDTPARDAQRLTLTGRARTFSENEFIVSKTDPRGVMTYTNKLFLDISEYTEAEMLGQPHNVIRHPHMPRCIFKLMWESIKTRQEVFAYVMNRCKNGDHYWVLAHVTPTLNATNEIVGYHSSRRSPRAQALDVIQPLYRELQRIEEEKGGRTGLDAATQHLHAAAAKGGMKYDQFVLSI